MIIFVAVRRFLASILALCCLLASTGVAVQQHLCMGEEAGLSMAPVTPEAHHRCDRCGMDRKASKGCCEDVVKVLKAKESQRVFPASAGLPVFEWIAPPVKAFFVFCTPVRRAAPLRTAFYTRPPPPDDSWPLYLRLRVLRL